MHGLKLTGVTILQTQAESRNGELLQQDRLLYKSFKENKERSKKHKQAIAKRYPDVVPCLSVVLCFTSVDYSNDWVYSLGCDG